MAEFLADLPDLFYRHLLLIDLIDHRARVLHVGQRGLLHAAGITVIKNREVQHVFIGLGINSPGGVLSPGPIKAAFAFRVFALDGFAVVVDRSQNFFCPALSFHGLRQPSGDARIHLTFLSRPIFTMPW